MIARSWPLFLLLIFLPDYYLFKRFVCPRTSSVWLRAAWWIPTVVLMLYTLILLFSNNFTPENPRLLNFYLLLLGVFILPKALLAVTTWVAELFCKRRRWYIYLGAALGALSAWITVYGSFVGFQKLEVNRLDCYFKDLPAGFDGYRIAVFSDIHVGSYTGDDVKVLETAIDSLAAMNADAIFFLGDIQNIGPWEIREKQPILSRLKATDGIYSVLGNHDYSYYQGVGYRSKLAYEKQTVQAERNLGWRLLLNGNMVLHHNGDSIYLCGMEDNERKNTDHGYGRIEKAVEGVGKDQFAILLSHNPKTWRMQALPQSHVQLSLSGHTHGGQVNIFGLTPTSLLYPEEAGLYEENGRQLFVTKGIGALIPLRFNVPGEVVLLTLHKQTDPSQKSTYTKQEN